MKTFVSMLLTLAASQAFASPAVIYNCVGKDALTHSSVVLELAFTDHAREAGYTNQSITITKKGWETLENPIVFQMFEANNTNSCTTNEYGQIFLENDLNMTPTEVGDIADYKITVKSNCKDNKFDIQAYCVFQ